jgi:arsenite methyltransferase
MIVAMSHQQGPPANQRLIPFACAADAAGMQTNTRYPTPGGVDPEELDRQIAEMYRDVANEAGRDLHFPTGRPLAETLGYPADLLSRLPAHAVNSFAGVGYHLGLARLLPGERVLDLGSGSGMDVFAAAAQVGPAGSVTGVDITPEQLAKSERLRRGGHVSFHRARIEELPFEDGSFDAVISNGVINLSADKRRVFAEAERVLRPGGRLALADIVTERRIAARTSCQADLWAACIAGASQRDLYLADIAAVGLELQVIHANRGYRFASERAQRTSHKYGAHSVSLLALKPVPASRHISNPNPGGGARVAQAAREEGPTNTTTTQEVKVSTVTDTIRNGVDTEKMFATLDLITAQPELAKFQFRASNRWIDGSHNRSTIKGFYAAGGEDTTRSEEFVIDAGEPAILLGTDTGPNPVEYLLHALAACLTTTIVYVAAARKVELTSVESTLTGDMDVRGALGVDDEPRNGFERIGVSFRVTGNAPEDKLREVVERAQKRSAVYDMVTNGVPVAVDVTTT